MVNIREEMNSDDGVSLVEVIVAATIFAMIALGVGTALVTSLGLTADSRSRVAAANLAASEIDRVRAAGDPFQIFDDSFDKTVGTTKFTVTRDTEWVQASSAAEGCKPSSGTSAGTLQYKRVNVKVTWKGLGADSVAYADTLLAPQSRINDPAYGSILVSVLGADGTGRSGVGISVSGSARIPKAPAATDADGCSYVLSVPPGTYTVTASRAGYVDVSQTTNPSVTVTVGQGSAVAASFQYDQQAAFALAYPENTVVPTNLEVSFLSTYGVVTRATASNVPLHPFAAGYAVLAGRYVAPTTGSTPTPGCVSPDASAWQAGTVNGKNMASGIRQSATTAAPGGTVRADVRMGLIDLTATSTSMRLVPVTAPQGVGDPGCGTSNPTTYTYTLPATGDTVLAAPYGSWRLEEKVGSAWQTVTTDRYAVISNAAGDIDSAGDVTTIDPRGLVQ